MAQRTITYSSDKVQRGEPLITKFNFKITGTKTVTNQTAAAAYSTFDAIAAQSTIDDFLGTTNEFLIAGFAATPMGTGAFGAILDFQGQVQELIKVNVKLLSGTDLGTVAETESWPDTALTATLVMSCQKGTNGNVAFHTVFTGLDSVSAGTIEVSVYWRSK